MDDLHKFKGAFFDKFKKIGAQGFYNYLLGYCLKKIVLIEGTEYKGILPHLEMLNYYDNSLTLYRREGDESYFQLAKLFRKVGHKIYRVMLKRQITSHDDSFLTDVSRN